MPKDPNLRLEEATNKMYKLMDIQMPSDRIQLYAIDIRYIRPKIALLGQTHVEFIECVVEEQIARYKKNLGLTKIIRAKGDVFYAISIPTGEYDPEQGEKTAESLVDKLTIEPDRDSRPSITTVDSDSGRISVKPSGELKETDAPIDTDAVYVAAGWVDVEIPLELDTDYVSDVLELVAGFSWMSKKGKAPGQENKPTGSSIYGKIVQDLGKDLAALREISGYHESTVEEDSMPRNIYADARLPEPKEPSLPPEESKPSIVPRRPSKSPVQGLLPREPSVQPSIESTVNIESESNIDPEGDTRQVDITPCKDAIGNGTKPQNLVEPEAVSDDEDPTTQYKKSAHTDAIAPPAYRPSTARPEPAKYLKQGEELDPDDMDDDETLQMEKGTKQKVRPLIRTPSGTPIPPTIPPRSAIQDDEDKTTNQLPAEPASVTERFKNWFRK